MELVSDDDRVKAVTAKLTGELCVGVRVSFHSELGTITREDDDWYFVEWDDTTIVSGPYSKYELELV